MTSQLCLEPFTESNIKTAWRNRKRHRYQAWCYLPDCDKHKQLSPLLFKDYHGYAISVPSKDIILHVCKDWLSVEGLSFCCNLHAELCFSAQVQEADLKPSTRQLRFSYGLYDWYVRCCVCGYFQSEPIKRHLLQRVSRGNPTKHKKFSEYWSPWCKYQGQIYCSTQCVEKGINYDK